MTQAAVLAANASLMTTPSGTAPSYLCRAWVNFNGTGTVAIRASGNVSSITDNGTGDYTVNFATAMPDANYAWNTGGGYVGATGSDAMIRAKEAPTTGSIRLAAMNSSSASVDREYITVTIFR